ncbi:MAG: alpha/beta fold hydrolase [Gammaproteobacteria bacterium]
MRTFRRRAWALLLLAASAAAGAADGRPPAEWPEVAGASAERVDDPVLGGKLTLYRAGTIGRDAVLLVHGLGQNGARDWARIIPALAPHYAVYALDLPGFGASDKGNRPYTPANYVRVIEKAVAPRIGRPFHLVGHSMGAAIALAYAAAHPERIETLTLADMAGVLLGPVYAEGLAKLGLEKRTGAVEGDPLIDRMVDWMMSRVEGMAFSGDMVLSTPFLRMKVLRGDPNLIAGFGLAHHDFSGALRSVAAPTLLVWGSEDRIAPVRTGRLAEALLPAARLELLPGVAHVPMADAPARFNELLLEHLAGRPPAPKVPARTGPIEGKPQSCTGAIGAYYSGDIPKLTLNNCTGVQVSGARIGELVVTESDVELLNTEVAGRIRATRSRVQLTGGSVAGAPPLVLDTSDVDAAGTRFAADRELAENAGKTPVTVQLSVAELRRGQSAQYLHQSLRVDPRD